MTDGNDANARPDSAAAAAPDEWSPVNLNKSVSPPDHGFSPPPGYPDPGPGYSAAQPGFTGPQTGQTAPPPDYSAAARGYATPGYPSATPDPYSAAYGYAAYPVRGSGTDGLAVAALACGVLGLMCCLPGPVALILGIVSLRNNNRNPLDGGGSRGMAIAGIVLGAIASVVIAVYLVGVVIAAVSGS